MKHHYPRKFVHNHSALRRVAFLVTGRHRKNSHIAVSIDIAAVLAQL